MGKLIITAAISGAEVRKVDNKNLPVTPEELAFAAKEAEDAGASIIHLHVRDRNGFPSQDINIFSETIDLMKKYGVKAIVQPSTGGAVNMSIEERLQPVKLKPEMLSLDCGSLNFGENEVFVNTPEMIRSFASQFKKMGILPEFECFDMGHISNALEICDGDLKPIHLHFNFVLGVRGGIPANIQNLLMMVNRIPNDATWTVSAIGRHQLSMIYQVIPTDGHIRVGFEDNIYYSYGVLAKSNAQLVKRVVYLAGEYGREVASPDEARRILKIS